MNFLVLGTPFLLFMLNYDWPLSYAIKLVGAVFIFIGLTELKNEFLSADKTKRLLMPFIILNAVSAVVIFCIRSGNAFDKDILKVPLCFRLSALLFWAAATIGAVYIMKQIYHLLDADRDLLFGTVNLVKLEYTLKKIYFVTIFVYISNVFYVLLPYRQTGDFFGVLMAIGKMFLYVLIIVATVRLFGVRSDYYRKAEDSEE